jgi:hypothetical protein
MMVPRRALTVCAVSLLWLDAVFLGVAGVVRTRPVLVLAGAACALASLVVLVAWRRYRRTLAEVAAARRDIARDAEAIQAILRARPSPQ